MRVPPSTPSITYSSHSGRDRSSGRAWIRQTTSASCCGVPGAGTAWWRTWKSMSKSGSSIQYGRSRPNGTSTSRRRYGASWSMRSRMTRLVASTPAPPGESPGSKMFTDPTWPKTELVSMLRKLTSTPESCFMLAIVGPVAEVVSMPHGRGTGRTRDGPRGGRRLPRLRPGRRLVGVEQRRAGRRRRSIAARRHAVRPAPHRRDARGAGAAHDRGADRRRRQHPRQRRPLLRQRARRRRRDHRLVGGRRGDGRGPTRAARRAQRRARRRRRPVPQLLR